MCICSDRLAVQDCEMRYMNAWLKRCVLLLSLVYTRLEALTKELDLTTTRKTLATMATP